jgi:hypothetical protein
VHTIFFIRRFFDDWDGRNKASFLKGLSFENLKICFRDAGEDTIQYALLSNFRCRPSKSALASPILVFCRDRAQGSSEQCGMAIQSRVPIPGAFSSFFGRNVESEKLGFESHSALDTLEQPFDPDTCNPPFQRCFILSSRGRCTEEVRALPGQIWMIFPAMRPYLLLDHLSFFLYPSGPVKMCIMIRDETLVKHTFKPEKGARMCELIDYMSVSRELSQQRTSWKFTSSP